MPPTTTAKQPHPPPLILIHKDILLDAFQLFPRNTAESWFHQIYEDLTSAKTLRVLQLVCRRWNSLIYIHVSTLPRHRIYSLKIDMVR